MFTKLTYIILLLHLSTLANPIPISSESTDRGYTIPMIKIWTEENTGVYIL